PPPPPAAPPPPRPPPRAPLTRPTDQTAVPDGRTTGTAVSRRGGHRLIQPDDACGCGGDASRTGWRRGGDGRFEMPLPHHVADVVVDRVHVVRTAGDERHRNEQRHAVRGHTLCEAVQATWLVVE